LAGTFERSLVQTICQQDLSPQEIAMGRQLRNLVGDTCVPVDITMPPDCVAFDVTGTIPIPVPACTSQTPNDCFQLVTDAAARPAPAARRLAVPCAAAERDDVASLQAVIDAREGCHLACAWLLIA